MNDPAITAEAAAICEPCAFDNCHECDETWCCCSVAAEVERLSGEVERRVPLSDVGRLLERVLGIPGEDWKVERWDTEYEGWSGTLRPTCVCDRDGCFCCDGMNLSADDMALIAAALTDEGGE